MATLYSNNKEKAISLYLHRDITDREWLRYQIIVEVQKTNQTNEYLVFNEETVGTPLFLECYIEPEIPDLIKGIQDVCENCINIFEFEPIDEKDFYLAVTVAENEFYINLLLRFNYKSERVDFYTTKEQLLTFVEVLNKEYMDVINDKYGLIER